MKTIIFLLLIAASVALGQQQPTQTACPATEKAILDVYQVQHQAFYKRDFSTFARAFDDQAIINYDDGQRRSKNDAVAAVKHQQSGNEMVDNGPMNDTIVKFEGGVAILNLEHGMRTLDLNAGFTTTAAFRESYLFGCRGGGWKIIFRFCPL